LVAAEEELGSLFALVERAAGGGLKLAEMAALFWHCIAARPEMSTCEKLSREKVGAAIIEAGLVNMTPILKLILSQILQGRV
jgi:hypothetical protein